MAGIREPETLARPEPGVIGDEVPGAPEDAVRGDAVPCGAVRCDGAGPGLRMGDAVRSLAVDAVRAAGSGDAGLALGMADVAGALWLKHLRFDAVDPRWADRDRFVLSAGPGAMMLYALLDLTGHAGMDRAALRRFRQIDSPAAGMPEHGEHPAIEATGGPPGQGLATAVGMALAERMLAARFGRSLVDHRTWVVAGDDDLVQGVSLEAACLAGELRLEKLTVLWHARAGDPGVGDTLKRFAAAGWTTRRIDSADEGEIGAALALAVRSRKPTLVACCPAAESGEADWPASDFTVEPALEEAWLRAGARGTAPRRAWLKRLANHPLRAEFERMTAGRLPEAWHEAAAALKAEWAETRPGLSTALSGRRVLEVLAAAIPELTAGGAGQDAGAVTPENYGGRHVSYGRRDHAMAACVNGMALHGGLLPCAEAALVTVDAMRPALRLAALMRQRAVLVLDQDGIGVGQDGPTQQPVEQLASLRAMPGLVVLRPADAIETVECWELAVRRAEGPSLVVLCSQAVPAVRTEAAENRCARGGYVLAEADGPRLATLIASGSEVGIAMEARRLLAEEGIAVAVVSLPCWELFAAQDESSRALVLGPALRVGIEAACGFGWERWLGPEGLFIGMTGYGASAPSDILYRHFGITPEAIAAAVRKRLPQCNDSTTEGI